MLNVIRSIPVVSLLAAVIASRSEMPSAPGVAISAATEVVVPLTVSVVFVTTSVWLTAVMLAANSEVSIAFKEASSRVAVAEMTAPAETLAVSTVPQVTVPDELVRTLTNPRYVCPSPLPEASPALFEKISMR